MEKASALMDMHFFTNALQKDSCSTLQLQKLNNAPSRSLGQKDTRAEGEPEQNLIAWATAVRDGPTISLDGQHIPSTSAIPERMLPAYLTNHLVPNPRVS